MRSDSGVRTQAAPAVRLAPWRRSSRWTCCAGTAAGERPLALARAAQTPAACPVAVAMGMTR